MKSASGLSQQQTIAAQIVAAGGNTSEAAERAGVVDRTVRKWLQREDFTAEIDRLQGEAAASTKRRLRALGRRACETLRSVMADDSAAPSARVAAAGRVLDCLFRIEELDRLTAIETRLAAIEAQQGITQKNRWN